MDVQIRLRELRKQIFGEGRHLEPARVADPAPIAIDSQAVKWRFWMLCAALVVSAGSGCSRPPLGEFCPDVAEGDLVITEIRGPQSGGDNRGQWFEVYNASDRPVDMRGLRIEFFDLQGGRVPPGRPILVRGEEVVVEPGEYITFGHHEPDRVPPFVDYTLIIDFFTVPTLDDDEVMTLLELGLEPEDFEDRTARDFEDSGRIDLIACDVLIDRLRYENLPREGTLSLDGSFEPDAEANDNAANFCVDNAEEQLEPGEPQIYFGLPGTPQEENVACAQ